MYGYMKVFRYECVLCFVYVTGVRINNSPGDVILTWFVYYKKYKYLREHASHWTEERNTVILSRSLIGPGLVPLLTAFITDTRVAAKLQLRKELAI